MRITIIADPSITPEKAISYVNHVMGEGRISCSKFGPSYCAMSVFMDKIRVECRRTLAGYSFHVRKPL
jgi:hypothetical protein